jgi:hypothetical protein
MSEPEIDRRCILCGAAVRPRATFCPQCGQPVPEHGKASETKVDLNQTQAIVNTNETVSFRREPVTDLSETAEPVVAVPTAVPPSAEPAPPVQNIARAKEPRAKGRVDKIRRASSVVIDQAAYDPSLRFVLVAAAFFLLFLFLLVMSKVLG